MCKHEGCELKPEYYVYPKCQISEMDRELVLELCGGHMGQAVNKQGQYKNTSYDYVADNVYRATCFYDYKSWSNQGDGSCYQFDQGEIYKVVEITADGFTLQSGPNTYTIPHDAYANCFRTM